MPCLVLPEGRAGTCGSHVTSLLTSSLRLHLCAGFAVYTGQAAICKVRPEEREDGRLTSGAEAGAPVLLGPNSKFRIPNSGLTLPSGSGLASGCLTLGALGLLAGSIVLTVVD